MAKGNMSAPRGTRDILPEESRLFRWVENLAWTTANEFGFEEIQTPIFEFSHVFQKTLGESSDIVTKEMYTFTDKGGEQITLRPEGTAGVVRALISEQMSRQLPLKFYYKGPMFRYERPQKGRYRQFHQIGVELLGVASNQGEVEAISMAYLFLKRLGIAQDCTLELNSIGDPESRKSYHTSLVEFLNAHRSDLSEESQNRITRNPLRVLDSKDEGDQKVLAKAPKITDYLNEASLNRYEELKASLSAIGISFKENPFLVRGLDYYCHTVFEFKTDKLGAQSAVLAGGRYDALVAMMGGPDTPGVGWAAGLERLSLLAQKPQDTTSKPKLAVIALGEDTEQFALKLAFDLRDRGYITDQAYSGNLSKRMKKASKFGAQWVIIIGSEELAQRKLTLKHLENGEQKQIDLDQIFNFLDSTSSPQ